MNNLHTTDQWLVFTIEDRIFATHVDTVRELTTSHDHQITPMPQTEKHVVGAFNLRGRVISVWDLRTLLGLPSLEQETGEIVKLLEQREQDHLNWIRELKRSVDESREFTLARDPQGCAFGKWYDALVSDEERLQKMTNSNFTLYRLLGQLDTPHRSIHAIADKVTRLVHEGDAKRAHEVIDATSKTELDIMVNLLRQIRQLLHKLRKPLIVILESNGKQLGIQVDSINSVIRIKPERIQPVPELAIGPSLFTGIAHLEGREKLLMLLDGAKLVEKMSLDADSLSRSAAAQGNRPQPAQIRQCPKRELAPV